MLLAVAAPACAAAGATTTAPARIISLTPAITETLFALGLGGRVVGVSVYCTDPPEAARLPKVGTFSEPVAEAIVALHPDLVLTSPSPGNESAVRAVERAGVRVAVVQSEGGLAEAKGAMLEVAREAGADEQGTRLVASIDARLDALRRRASPLEHPRVAVVVGRDPLVLAGPASYLGELVTLAGGVNITDRVGGRWPRIGLEFLVAAAPDVLVDLSAAMSDSGGQSASGGDGKAERDTASAWAPIAAGTRVVASRERMMLRPGPRLADAADALFAAIHPEAASDPAARSAAPRERER